MGLNIIDFSNGIRPEEIQDNFEYLQAQISRERLSVGGSGIASGLDIAVDITENKFNLIISDGVVVDDEGNEIFIEGKTLEITPPKLQQYKELCSLSKDKTIHLKHTPYALNRRRPVEFLSSFEPEVSGITIKYRDSISVDDYIRVREVMGRTVVVTGALKRDLEVSYSYTAKRIDTIYINNNLEISKAEGEGTTSTTPSISKLPDDARYLIAYIEVDNEYKDETDTTPHAYIYVKDDLRSTRNLYTSSDGTLYICGIPFDDLQIIHLKEPQNPKPNTLWLNLADNTLYIWRSVDDFAYKNKIDITTDFSENIDASLNFSTYMSFEVGANELSVYLNGSKLINNQDYEEIGIEVPTSQGNIGQENIKGNVFKILNTLIRPDGYNDVLVPGDELTYVIRYKDSQYMWVPINKMNYVTVKNKKVYSTYYEDIDEQYIYESIEGDRKAYFDSSIANSLGDNPFTDYPYNYQYFLFHRIEDMNMHFTPGKHELSIMVNQMYLHEDQFEEITIYDLIEEKLPDEVLAASIATFGWTKEYLSNNFNGVYDNSGIGFKLVEPLDSGANADTISSSWENLYGSNDLFVEAIVERRVCSTPLNSKLERSATFIYENSVAVSKTISDEKIIFIDNAKYRYDEHQLEVFLDGMKQILGKDYIEEFGYLNDTTEIKPIDTTEVVDDQDYYIRKKAAICNKFKFVEGKILPIGSTVTYKITTNVYSYDHINNILNSIGDVIEDCKTTVENSSIMMNEFTKNINDRVESMENQVKEISEFRGEFLTSQSMINEGQLPEILIKNMIKSLAHINTSIELQIGTNTYSLIDIYPEDYITVIYRDITNVRDRYYIEGVDYKITQISNSVFLEIINPDSFDTGDKLFITGIKISSKRSWN